jgi:hypothetical protein
MVHDTLLPLSIDLLDAHRIFTLHYDPLLQSAAVYYDSVYSNLSI